MNFSNAIHPAINTDSAVSSAWIWMLRNWYKYLNDDAVLDTESLAEQAALEFDLEPATAAGLAEQVKTFVDKVTL